ncbi:MAG: hypothetical protein DSY60_02760 [Persephonella sp.]|nr:MAG: hypothetical protein DSY60_02760 [Persephonella sp.]
MCKNIKWFRKSCEILEMLKNLRNDISISPEKRDILEEILKDALALKFVAEFEKSMLFIILPKEVEGKTYRDFRKKMIKENKLQSWKKIFNSQLWEEIRDKSKNKMEEIYGYSRFNPEETEININSIINYRNNHVAHETEGTTAVLDINSVEKCIQYFDIFLTLLNEKIKGKS